MFTAFNSGSGRQESLKASVAGFVLGALVILAVGGMDHLSGAHLSLSIFYLIPVAIVAWKCGRGAGVALVAAVVVVSFAADASHPRPHADSPGMLTVAWNALMRGAAGALVVALTELQRRALDRETHLARTDALTGLPNRRQLLETVAAELDRWERYRRPFSVVLLDVDRFKQINDGFGHEAGDAVLQGVAERLTARVRKTDLVARVGGDEFALVLPETDRAHALDLAASLRMPFVVPMRPTGIEALPVHLSVGTATVAGNRVRPAVEDVFDAADKAMYRDKRSKGATPPLDHPPD